MSVEDCAVCGHHVSFHERGYPPKRGSCWHGRDNLLLVAIDAVRYAEALGLGKEERVTFMQEMQRAQIAKSCKCYWFLQMKGEANV